MNRLDHEGLWFMQALNDTEEEKCRTCEGLYKVHSVKFKPSPNETVLLLEYCKLAREQNSNAEELMSHLWHKDYECGYKKDWRLKGQFINGFLITLRLFIRNILFNNTVKQLRKFSFNDGIPLANAQMSSDRWFADVLNESLQMAVYKVKVLDQTNKLSVES